MFAKTVLLSLGEVQFCLVRGKILITFGIDYES